MPHIRGANRGLLLELLHKHRSLSRAEIARRTGLSEAAVSRITAGLLDEGLLVERGEEGSTGGRPARRLELEPDRFLAAGVDIRDFETCISLGQMSGRVIQSETMRTPENPADVLDMIVDRVTHLRRGPRFVYMEGVGISTRGLVDSRTGVVELGGLPAWRQVAVKQPLEQRLGLPVYVENDVRAATLAEFNFGDAAVHGYASLMYVRVGEGVGMGLVLDGELYRGPRMAAGELGQMIVSDSSGPVVHDRPGCLESFVFNPAVCARYAEYSGLRQKINRGEAAAWVRRICHLAMKGDEPAIRTLRDTGRYLGIGIANVVWALDVETVIVEGPLTDAWPVIAPAIQERLPDGRDFLNFRDLSLRPGRLRHDAALIGALALPFARLMTTGETARRRARRNGS